MPDVGEAFVDEKRSLQRPSVPCSGTQTQLRNLADNGRTHAPRVESEGMTWRMCSGSDPETRYGGRQAATEKSRPSFQVGTKRTEYTRTVQKSDWTVSWLVSASAINTVTGDEYPGKMETHTMV